MNNRTLIDRLNTEHSLKKEEWEQLFSTYTKDDVEYATTLSREIAIKNLGKKIYFRGIIEFSNFCKCDCYYCGIRRSNACAQRYRLDPSDIYECCREGYENGFRTFVLQGGEDGWFNDDRMCEIVKTIKETYPDCAVTLSLGERSYESYKRLNLQRASGSGNCSNRRSSHFSFSGPGYRTYLSKRSQSPLHNRMLK